MLLMRRVMLLSPRLIKRAGGIGVVAIADLRLSNAGALGVGASSSGRRHRLKTTGAARMRRGQTSTSGVASGAGGLTDPQRAQSAGAVWRHRFRLRAPVRHAAPIGAAAS